MKASQIAILFFINLVEKMKLWINIFILFFGLMFKINLNSNCAAKDVIYKNSIECGKNCEPCDGFYCQFNYMREEYACIKYA